MYFIGFITLWPIANFLAAIISSNPDLEDLLYPLVEIIGLSAFILWYLADIDDCLWEKFIPFPEESLINPINNIIDIIDF